LVDNQQLHPFQNHHLVLASPRSGTTWLSVELLSHNTFCFNEPLIGEHLGFFHVRGSHNNRNIDDHQNRGHYFFAKKFHITWKFYLRKLILNRIYTQFKELDKVVIVQEPNGGFGMDVIADCLPKSKLILLLRDGRDILNSKITALSKGGYAAEADKRFEPLKGYRRLDFIKTESIFWVEIMEILMKAYESHNSDLRLKLRYEDLRKNTLTELRKIYKFLGLEISEPELNEVINKFNFENLPSNAKGLGTPRQYATVGKWKEEFSQEEKKMIEEIEGQKLRDFGYDVQ